jgi:pimeloyl-ACP methyl ester carboxylesterase
MNSSEPSRESGYDRRHFLGVSALAIGGVGAASLGAARPGATGSAPAGPGVARATATGTPGSFGPVRQIDAGVLNIGYVDLGPRDGFPVVLMHGFPYDIHSYVEVAPLLAVAGYRAIVPYFRGFGTTTFLSASTPRNVDQVAWALDIVALMDALGLDRAIMAGYDYGSRTGDVIAALWPQRVKALVSVTGYLITNLAAQKLPQPPAAENAFWYEFYFSTERGVLGLEQYRTELGEFVWKFNSPTWNFDQATYLRTAAAFENPDYVTIIIGNYRWRLGLLPAEPEYASQEAKLQQAPPIAVPTITIDGKYDPFTPAGNGSAYRAKFTGKYQHRVLNVGHNVPQEDPRGFVKAVIDADRL